MKQQKVSSTSIINLSVLFWTPKQPNRTINQLETNSRSQDVRVIWMLITVARCRFRNESSDSIECILRRLSCLKMFVMILIRVRKNALIYLIYKIHKQFGWNFLYLLVNMKICPYINPSAMLEYMIAAVIKTIHLIIPISAGGMFFCMTM